MKQRLIAFIGTTSPERAERFYRDGLGLEFVADEPSALVFNSNGTMLRVSKVQSFEPAPFTVLGWSNDDIREKVDDLVSRGVEFEGFEGFDQDEQGISSFLAALGKTSDGGRLGGLLTDGGKIAAGAVDE